MSSNFSIRFFFFIISPGLKSGANYISVFQIPLAEANGKGYALINDPSYFYLLSRWLKPTAKDMP